MEPVRGHRSRTVVDAARLHRARERKQTGTTLIEGPHLLEEALRAGATVVSVFAHEGDTASRSLADDRRIPLRIVDDTALTRLSGTETPRGPIAVVEIPTPAAVGGQAMLVSWGVSDPGNVGTMIRIAAGFGWGFGYHRGTADPWSPRVLRSGAGNQFRTEMSPVTDIDVLMKAGFGVIATVVSGGEAPADIPSGRWAVLIGEEASGLPDAAISAADRRVTIPMPGEIESLNAGVAAGIITYELTKRIGQGGGQG